MVYVNGLGPQPLRRLFGVANGSSESVRSQKIDQAQKVVVQVCRCLPDNHQPPVYVTSSAPGNWRPLTDKESSRCMRVSINIPTVPGQRCGHR